MNKIVMKKSLIICISIFCFACCASEKKEKISKMNDHLISNANFVQPQFEEYLRAEPLLLTTPGCKVLTLRDKKKLIVAVGCTSTENKNIVQILSDIGDKPYAELIKVKSGVHISVKTHYSDSFAATELHEIIKTLSYGYIRALPVIAHWYSPDGRLFYQAVGDYVK